MNFIELELSRPQRDRLDEAHDHAIDKYRHYRRHGLTVDEAYRAALAWGRNTTEQADRRLAHQTGACRGWLL